jgi:hypothetical protein
VSDFIHAREYLHEGDIVIVHCSHQCNVRVMDDFNFDSYRYGDRHRFYGGFYRMLPARIAVPSDGYWNTTIDLGGGSANIRCNINYFKGLSSGLSADDIESKHEPDEGMIAENGLVPAVYAKFDRT